MKHSGKAMQAALRLIGWGLVIVVAVCSIGLIAKYVHELIAFIAGGLFALWIVFSAFTLYFFRDPQPVVPGEAGVIVSPGQGTVDVIDEFAEDEFMGGPCQRISTFLSPLDVHVQRAIVKGRVAYVRHKAGKFLSAMRLDCGLHNENVLIGFECAGQPGVKVAVRLIAGVLARRIIPWVEVGDQAEQGERISLIQFGSRCDIYMPRGVKVAVKLGDKVKAGQTILARF